LVSVAFEGRNELKEDFRSDDFDGAERFEYSPDATAQPEIKELDVQFRVDLKERRNVLEHEQE